MINCKECLNSGRIEAYNQRTQKSYSFRCDCVKGQSFSNLIKDWFNAYTKIGWVKRERGTTSDERIKQAREASRPAFLKE